MSNKTEVKSFDDWYTEAKKLNNDGFSAKDFFEAGQQSKQAEIDELQIGNHHLSIMTSEAESYSEYWKYERDKLQKKIDDLKAFCIKGVESNMLSIEYNQALIDMHKILKGEETK